MTYFYDNLQHWLEWSLFVLRASLDPSWNMASIEMQSWERVFVRTSVCHDCIRF